MDKEKLDKNLYKILKIQLAIENYEANTGDKNEIINQAFLEISIFRKERINLDISKQVELSNSLLIELDKILGIIGKEKFDFYDDGCIEYTWK